jgi:hypothetical protein
MAGEYSYYMWEAFDLKTIMDWIGGKGNWWRYIVAIFWEVAFYGVLVGCWVSRLAIASLATDLACSSPQLT